MCIRQLVCMSKADIPSFWHTACFSVWSSSQIQSSCLKWSQIPVCGTTELETRGCLANRTSFPKLQRKPRELHAVKLNLVRSSRPSHSTAQTSGSARTAQAGSPVLNPSRAPSGSSLFSCSSWTRQRPGMCLFHNVALPGQRASIWPQQSLLPSGVWLWHKGTLIL